MGVLHHTEISQDNFKLLPDSPKNSGLLKEKDEKIEELSN